MSDQHTPQDPTAQHPSPSFPEQSQPHPAAGRRCVRYRTTGRAATGSGRPADRVALITGADSGIGRAITLAFAREHADIAFSHLPEEQADAEETTRLVTDAGRRTRAVAGNLREEGFCTDINTASVQTCKPSPHLLDYAMTKAAIVAFTQGLALRLAPDGIRVNAVVPGPVWTPLIPATMDEEKVAHFGEQSPLGRTA